MYFSSIIDSLIRWDRRAFEWVNTGLANPFFDAVMPFLRNSLHWIPLYLFMLVFVLMNFKIKGIWWVIFFLVTVALTDMIGNYALKQMVERERPCWDPELNDHIRLLLGQCSRGYSFVSNHAANHFGMAAFFFITFRSRLPRWRWVAFIWALLVAFAQVYIGVHYPLDVIGGALLGLALGLATGSFFNKRFGITIFDHQPVA